MTLFYIRHASVLFTLDLKNNLLTQGIRSIPGGFCQLTNLRKLDLSNNNLTALPRVVLRLPNLTDLNVGLNAITRLPDNFYELRELMVFDIRHNPLVVLPACLNRNMMPNLSFVCVWGCRLELSTEMKGTTPQFPPFDSPIPPIR
jgi:Leucine-rich repeat (LRR) protein